MKKAIRKSYAVSQSPLFRLRSRAKLADLLGETPSRLRELISDKSYCEWSTKAKYPDSKNKALVHKPRAIQQPLGALDKAQRRLNLLLSRLELPDYLHSAKKGRSYRTNAAAHAAAGRAIKVDIRQFYKSVHDGYIHAFFREVMECSPDVTHILTEITSYQRYLPTGSALSPVVSFLAYRPMFEKLNLIAASVGAVMTVYVDDVVMSGPGVSGSLIPACKRVMKDHGLRGHKVAFYHAGDVRIITGVAVGPSGLSIPNKRLRKIRALREEMDRSLDAETRDLYRRALVGQLREGSPLDPSFKAYSHVIERMP